jgi:hypothetical protein
MASKADAAIPNPNNKLAALRELRSSIKQEQHEKQRQLLANPLSTPAISASPKKLDPLFSDMSLINNSLRKDLESNELDLPSPPRKKSFGKGGAMALTPLMHSPERIVPDRSPRSQLGPSISPEKKRHRALAPL